MLTIAAGCADTTPRAFTGRTALPSCGEVERSPLAVPVSPDRQAALDCFATARTSRQAAEIVINGFSTEGDPMKYWVRTLTDGTAEYWSHSKGGWYYAACASLMLDAAGYPTPAECGARPR